jgi:hypothetical protein
VLLWFFRVLSRGLLSFSIRLLGRAFLQEVLESTSDLFQWQKSVTKFWLEGMRFAFQQFGESIVVGFEFLHVVALELEKTTFSFSFFPSFVPSCDQACVTTFLSASLHQNVSVNREDYQKLIRSFGSGRQ